VRLNLTLDTLKLISGGNCYGPDNLPDNLPDKASPTDGSASVGQEASTANKQTYPFGLSDSFQIPFKNIQ